jgi:prepilin signal peptidase PulO-like enzyme (type II secretory pathway)
MIALLLACIGLPVGLALDRIVLDLAVPADMDEEDVTPNKTKPPKAGRRRPAGAEAGSLVIDLDQPARDWVRRLIIVAATVGLFAAAGARYNEPAHLAIVTAYICVLIICAATDLLAFRVPNVITYPAILGAFVIAAAMPDASLPSALAGAGVAGGALLLPSLVTGGLGMGMGDVKLATFVGLALGFTFIVPALLVMALSGGGAAALLLITRARKRGEPIPYAPFIATGALAALLWQGAAFVSLS